MRAVGVTFAFTCLLGSTGFLHAERIYGLTPGSVSTPQGVFSFDSAAPGTVTPLQPVTGLFADDGLASIDFRPADGQLYGVSSRGRIYVVDPATGAATLVSTISGVGDVSALFPGAADFNPVVDLLRAANFDDRNLRINVGTGVAIEDSTLAYGPGDVRAGVNPAVLGLAYTNSVPGAATTTLYALEASLGFSLAVLPSPNSGTMVTVGPLGVSGGSAAGFDISGLTGTAYASLISGTGSQLYTINLQTGAATLAGTIGNGTLTVTGLAVQPVPEPSTLVPLGLSLIGLLSAVARRRALRRNQAAHPHFMAQQP